jgi:ribosomal protein L32
MPRVAIESIQVSHKLTTDCTAIYHIQYKTSKQRRAQRAYATTLQSYFIKICPTTPVFLEAEHGNQMEGRHQLNTPGASSKVGKDKSRNEGEKKFKSDPI